MKLFPKRRRAKRCAVGLTELERQRIDRACDQSSIGRRPLTAVDIVECIVAALVIVGILFWLLKGAA
jgi:hypothetical protein